MLYPAEDNYLLAEKREEARKWQKERREEARRWAEAQERERAIREYELRPRVLSPEEQEDRDNCPF